MGKGLKEARARMAQIWLGQGHYCGINGHPSQQQNIHIQPFYLIWERQTIQN